jgi:hypothetical protein
MTTPIAGEYGSLDMVGRSVNRDRSATVVIERLSDELAGGVRHEIGRWTAHESKGTRRRVVPPSVKRRQTPEPAA